MLFADGVERLARVAQLAYRHLGWYGLLAMGAVDAIPEDVGVGGRQLLGVRWLFHRILHALPVLRLGDREVFDLIDDDPFKRHLPAAGVKRYVCVLGKPAPKAFESKLHMAVPTGRDWQVKVVAGHGRCVLCLHRAVSKRSLYPNEVVEKMLGVPATTRGWDTIGRIASALAAEL